MVLRKDKDEIGESHQPDVQMTPQGRTQLTWRRKLLFWPVSGVLMALSVLAVGELVLPLLPLFSDSFVSSRFRQYDSELGVSLIPSLKVSHHRGCFKGEVYINRWGMRDRDRSIEKIPGQFRIALLGDSVVEGVHVKPDEVMNIRMEELLREKGYTNAEVLNFGIASLGTAAELLVYRTRVRRFHPDLVVLLFLSSNDVMDNSSTLQPKAYGIHTWYAPYYDLGPDGELIFRPVRPRGLHKFRSFLESHSLVLYYLERIWLRVNPMPYRWEGIPFWWGVYGDPLDPEWERAWVITEKVLTLFEAAVSDDGGKFVVLILPEFFDINPNWRALLRKEVGKIPSSFRPSKSSDRLRQIETRNNITLDFLAPYMQSYRDKNKLQWPYFSLTCDVHYSALGHQVLAEAIVDQLERRRLLPGAAGRIR